MGVPQFWGPPQLWGSVVVHAQEAGGDDGHVALPQRLVPAQKSGFRGSPIFGVPPQFWGKPALF